MALSLTAKVISWRSVTHMYVFPGFLTLTQLSIQIHRLLFSHASEMRGKNTPRKKSSPRLDSEFRSIIKS